MLDRSLLLLCIDGLMSRVFVKQGLQLVPLISDILFKPFIGISIGSIHVPPASLKFKANAIGYPNARLKLCKCIKYLGSSFLTKSKQMKKNVGVGYK